MTEFIVGDLMYDYSYCIRRNYHHLSTKNCVITDNSKTL